MINLSLRLISRHHIWETHIRVRIMKSFNLVWFNITLQNDLSNQVIRLHRFQLTNSKGVSFSALQDCPEIIHGIMMDCWQSDPNKRPKFGEIVNRLDKIIRSPEVLEIVPLLQSTIETWVNKLLCLQNHTSLFCRREKIKKTTNNYSKTPQISRSV